MATLALDLMCPAQKKSLHSAPERTENCLTPNQPHNTQERLHLQVALCTHSTPHSDQSQEKPDSCHLTNQNSLQWRIHSKAETNHWQFWATSYKTVDIPIFQSVRKLRKGRTDVFPTTPMRKELLWKHFLSNSQYLHHWMWRGWLCWRVTFNCSSLLSQA